MHPVSWLEKSFTIIWAGGFAAVQKKKNIKALHNAAKVCGVEPVLEASTKSDERLGQRLSAFNLKIKTDEGDLPLECAYQGSKVFERGGPYTDLYFADPRSAKRDPRLQSSGKLTAFQFEGHKFPLEPKTVFYDWLYITAIFPHRVFLERLNDYHGFTDIEFNPSKSINCQARACALFVSLKAKHLLEEAVQSPESFIAIVSRRRPASVSPPMRAADAFSAIGVTPALAATKTGGQEGDSKDELQLAKTDVGAESSHAPSVADESAAAVPIDPPANRLSSEGPVVVRREAQDVLPLPATAEGSKAPPSNFELFVKEKAARQPQRVAAARSKRRKQQAKRTDEAGTLKLPPPSPRESHKPS